MVDKYFVQYIGDYRVHDGYIEEVIEIQGNIIVAIRSIDQEIIKFEFEGVKEVRNNNAKGMMLYSISEMSEVRPYRHFVFTNWDDNGTASLDIIARNYVIKENS